MTKNKLIIGAVVVVALAFWFGNNYHNTGNVFGANECATGQTCLPSMEFTGKNSGVTNTLQVDSGPSSIAGALGLSGAVSLTSTFQLGSSGTVQNQQNAGQCYIFPYTSTIGANADVKFTCQSNSAAGSAGAITAITGIQANDFLSLRISTSTAAFATSTLAANTTNSYVSVTGASASTTAGFIDGYLHNSSTSPITFTASFTSVMTGSYHSTR